MLFNSLLLLFLIRNFQIIIFNKSLPPSNFPFRPIVLFNALFDLSQSVSMKFIVAYEYFPTKYLYLQLLQFQNPTLIGLYFDKNHSHPEATDG